MPHTADAEGRTQRRFIILVSLICLLTAVSLGGAAVGLYSRFQSTNERRAAQASLNQQFKIHDMRQTQAWHIVFCDAEKVVLKSNNVTEQNKVAAIQFYDKELRRLGAAPCKEAK